MTADAHLVSQFYGSARGARDRARRCATGCWRCGQTLHNQSILGIGYAVPYLRLWREDATRCIALTPAHLGAARWPTGRAKSVVYRR